MVKNEKKDEAIIMLQDLLKIKPDYLQATQLLGDILYEEERFESHVLYKFKQEQPFTVTKDNDVYVIRGNEIEKIYKMTWFVTDEAFLRFSNKLRKLGIDDKLKEMGIQNGDTVRILDYEFEYRE